MRFNNCPLKNELKEGLLQYERDTKISPFSLVESLIEEFLYKKGYLVVGAADENVPFPYELNKPSIPYASLNNSGTYRIRKSIGGKKYYFGGCDYEDAKVIVEFLERKKWDIKYTTKKTKLKGKKHIKFLLNEIEKEKRVDKSK